MTNYLIMKGGSLSKIRPIYFGCAGFGQISRSFLLKSPTIRLKRSKNLAQTSTPSRRSLILDRLLGGILGHEGADFFSVNDTFQIS